MARSTHSRKILSVLPSVLCLVLVVALSGCATCCGGAPKAVSSSGYLNGAMGCSSCDKANGPLVIEKQMPKQIVVGQPYSYTIKVTNNSSCALDDVNITEKIPSQYKLSTANPEATRASGNIAEWALGYLAPKETKTITITGSADASGATVACTKASFNPMLCLGPQAISPNLKVAIEAPSDALVCDSIPVKVTVSNTGTGSADNIVVTQGLPKGLTTEDGKTSLTTNVSSLAGGTSKVYTVNLRAAQAGNYENSVSAKASNGLSASSQGVNTNVRQPVLKVGVKGPEKTFFGKNATYEVRAQNAGDVVSQNTVVTASIPAGMQFVSASDGGSVRGDKVVWQLGAVNAGQEVVRNATFRGVTGGVGESVATASGVCSTPASAATRSEVEGIPAILLEVIDLDDPIQVGGSEKYYITVTNQGSAPDKDIKVKVTFEENLDYVSSNGPTKATTAEAKTVEFAPLKALGAGQKAVWEVNAKAVSQGDHRTTVVLQSEAISRPVQETEATRIY